jgi:hemin uptake protein HemP
MIPIREKTSGGAPKGERAMSSTELFGGRREVLIDHEGQVYRLRITRNGKLIMNK